MSNIKLSDINRLDFNLAITFLALWQERSVSRAALRLSLSQSAVSSALARLRDAANDPLFIRTHGGMGYAKEYDVERYMREAMMASNCYGRRF